MKRFLACVVISIAPALSHSQFCFPAIAELGVDYCGERFEMRAVCGELYTAYKCIQFDTLGRPEYVLLKPFGEEMVYEERWSRPEKGVTEIDIKFDDYRCNLTVVDTENFRRVYYEGELVATRKTTRADALTVVIDELVERTLPFSLTIGYTRDHITESDILIGIPTSSRIDSTVVKNRIIATCTHENDFWPGSKPHFSLASISNIKKHKNGLLISKRSTSFHISGLSFYCNYCKRGKLARFKRYGWEGVRSELSKRSMVFRLTDTDDHGLLNGGLTITW